MRTPARLLIALVSGALTTASLSARADTGPRLLTAPEVRVAPTVALPADASVMLEVTVTEQGSVVDPVIVRGIDAETDASVLDAARAMRFSPAERDGQPVRVRVRFRFRVRREQPEPTAVEPRAQPERDPSDRAPETVPPNPFGPAPARPGASRTATIVVPTASAEPNEGAVVRGIRPEPGAATREVLRAEEMTTVPGTFGEPLRVVSTMPGVGRSPLAVGFFLVRGASFENTGFIVDGFPVLNLYHFGAGPSVIASPFVSQLEFNPGNYPVAFGRFSAGLIQVRTDVPRPPSLRAIVEVDLLRAGAFVAAPVGRTGSISFGARRSYFDPFLALIAPGVFVGYGDAQARFEVNLTDRTRYTAFAFASTDRFTIGPQGPWVASPYTAGLDYTFYRVINRVEHRASRDLRIEYAALLGWDRVEVLSNRRLGSTRTNESSVLSGTVIGQRLGVRSLVNSTHSFHGGLDALGQIYNVVASLRSNTVAPTQLTQISVAAFIEHTLKLNPVELVTGIRADYVRYAEYNRLLIDPRVVARWKAHSMVTIVAGSGIFHQLPNALLMVAGFSLPPQRAWQNSLGVELDLGAQFDARVTGYFNYLFDLPPTGGIAPSINDPGRDDDVGIDKGTLFRGQGRAYGVEFFLRRRLERGLYGWLSYTLSRSERFQPGGPVSLFNYDQTHVLNLALSWKINDRWRVGARFQLASGTPVANIVGSIYQSDSREFAPFTAPGDERTPFSNQLDLRVDYSFRWWRFRMNAFLDVMNAYNAQNGDLGWAYRYDYAQRVPGGGIPILPTIGIRGEL
ncbi:MAG: TonB family protein [Polyangiales bacterium]